MHKYLKYIIIGLIVIPYTTYASDTYQALGDGSSTTCRLGDISDRTKNAQSFTVPSNFTLDTVATYFDGSDGSPADNVQILLASDSSGSPGSTLATGSYTTPADSAWATTTLSYSLTSGTTYWLVWSRSGSLDGSNFRRMYGTTLSSYSGNAAVYNGSSWSNTPIIGVCTALDFTATLAMTTGVGGEGTATDTSATSTIDQVQNNLFYGFCIFFMTFLTIIYLFKKRS